MSKFVASRLSIAVLAVVLLGTSPANAGHLTEALEARLGTGAGQLASEQDERDLAMLLDFYRERGMAPLWVDEAAGVGSRARILSEVIAAAGLDGLDPADYGLSRIQGLLAARTPEDLATLEVGLSLGLVRLASDLAAGRLQPSQVENFVDEPGQALGLADDDTEELLFPRRFDVGIVIENFGK